MGYIYRLRDLSDGIIKYVGIIWSNDRSLQKGLSDHYHDEWYKDKIWEIEFIDKDFKNRHDAEIIKTHYILLLGTNRYYNKWMANNVSDTFVANHRWIYFKILDGTAINYMREHQKETYENWNLKINRLGRYVNPHCYRWVKENTFKHMPNLTKNPVNRLVKGRNKFFYEKNLYGKVALPCKAIIYRFGKKVAYRCFNSISECMAYCGLTYKQIIDSMLLRCNRVFFYYDSGICGNMSSVVTSIGDNIYNHDICIRFCSITPLKQSLESKYMKECFIV